MSDVQALRELGRVARENADKLAVGDHRWQGLAFRMRFATYGLPAPGLA